MKKLYGLKFDNPNNACLSLRTLAEWVRTGDFVIDDEKDWDGAHLAPLVIGFRKKGDTDDRV